MAEPELFFEQEGFESVFFLRIDGGEQSEFDAVALVGPGWDERDAVGSEIEFDDFFGLGGFLVAGGIDFAGRRDQAGLGECRDFFPRGYQEKEDEGLGDNHDANEAEDRKFAEELRWGLLPRIWGFFGPVFGFVRIAVAFLGVGHKPLEKSRDALPGGNTFAPRIVGQVGTACGILVSFPREIAEVGESTRRACSEYDGCSAGSGGRFLGFVL